MIGDNQDYKNLIKKMNHNPKAYFLISPDSHYANAMAIYTALKRQLDLKHYRTGSKRKRQSHITADEEPESVNFKGTVFHNCDIPYDVFHMSRRTKLTIKQ